MLTITKVVVNTGGGTATPSSWTYTLTGKRNNGGNVSPAVGYTFQSGVAQSVTATETSGNGAGVLRSYAITESAGPANYTLTGIVCTGATADGTFGGGTLTGLQLHSGDVASCTITNTYQAPPTASIVVRAGGQRTGAASVGALPDGAVYQAVPVGGGAAATCTIVSGQCTITVPAGAAYTVSAQTAAPGYYLSPSLDVGSSSSGSPTPYAFRTATLAANSTTTVPGTDVTSVYTDANGNRFSGMLAQSLQNPAVQQMCGLRIALVLDQSGSMAGAKQTALKAAADDVVTSLTGTPSTLAVYTFSAAAGPSVGATSTATAASAQPLHTFIDGLPAPSSYTNWDRGLGQVGAGFDLVILLTDGNPTTYAGGGVDGSNARIAYVEQGMFSANRIKGALGERLVAVGIGVDGGAENLRAVSGPTAGSDYFTASDTGFGATLKQLATGSCSNTMTIQKRIETAAGTIVDNSPAADGWGFSGTVSSGTIGAFAPTATQNGSTGFTSAAVGLPAGSSPTVSLTETAQPGYTLDRAASSCRVDGRSVAIDGTGSTITFTGAAGAAMSCVFVNRMVQTYGTFSVTKRISGDAGLVPGSTPFTVDYSYPAGSGYPSGSGHLTVTPGGGAVRSDPIPQGAVVHLSEAVRPPIPDGTWGDPVFSANDIAIGDGTDVAVTLTNPIRRDTGGISVVKSVTGDGAGAVPADAAFTVAYHWDAATNGAYAAGDGTIVVHNDGVPVGIPEVPVGAAVTLTEQAHASFPGVSWRSGTFSPAGPVVVTAGGQSVAVTLTNVYTVDTGGFTIAKRVTGDGARLVPSGTVFTVHYSYTGGIAGRPGAGSLGLIDGVPQSVTGLPAGAVVTFQEDAPAAVPGATWGGPVFDPAQLTIGAGGDARVTLENPITEIRPTLQLKKVVTDDVLPATDWVLTGTGDDSPTVTNPEGGDTAAVTVRTGASYTLAEAPKDGAAGTAEFAAGDWVCTDASGGTVTVDRTGPGAATLQGLSAGQAVVCTVTNTHQDQGVRLQKALAAPATQNADGTWTIRYTLTVANRSTLAATVYDLGDTLHFGGGIAVQQATWSGPTSGDFTGATAVLAQGAALAAGATATYAVSVTASVGSGAWRDGTTDCPDGPGDGGFLNTATVTSAGETTSSSACDSPGTLTVRKTAGAVAQGPDGHVTIAYDIVVTNATPKPQFYDLVDTPSPAPGATVVSASATRNGDPIAYDGGSLAAGAAIGGGSPEHPVTDHYVVTLEVDVAALDTSHATCDGTGTGLFNAATLSTGGIVRESDACADLPTGTLTLVKSVAAGFGGDQPSDAWTLTAAGASGRTISGRYSAADPDPAITAARVPTGTYALSEGPAIPGYALTGIVCADAEGGPVAVSDQAIELGAGMDVTCTFTNTPRPAHLTLIKEVADPDGSGTTKTPHDWTLTAAPAFDGFAPVSGRGDPGRADGVDAVPVWAGQYDLSESGPAGFAAGQWTCEGAGVEGAVVTIPLGADVTCTITNSATLPRLTLVKVVDNGDTGGRGVPSDWVVSAVGPTTFGGPGSDDPEDPDPAITRIGAQVGDYTLTEDGSAAPAGYELAGLSCTNTVDGTVLGTSAADPTLHLAEGDDVVCTFTNRAIPAAWTLSKTSNRGAAVMPGAVIRYVLTLTHTGGVIPRFLSLADVDDLSGVTPHASFVPGSLSASSGAATLEGGRLDWTLTDPSGPAFTLAYSFRVAPDAWGVTLRNALTPPRDVICPDGACETSSSTPDLELWKTAVVTSKADPADPTRVLPGGTVAYTLSAHNPTDVDLPAGQTETDDVSGLTGHATLGALGAGLSLDGPDRLTWTLPAVPAGATVSVGYSVTVADDAAGSTLTNTLVPGTGHCLPPADDGPGCTTSNDVPRVDLGIVKSASTEGPVDNDPGASSEYAYTLTVANHGDTEATDAVVTDVLPEQLDLDVAKGSGGFDDVPAGWTPAYDPASSTVTVRIPSLGAGDTAAIRIHVLVRPVVHGSVDAPVGAVPPGAEGPAPVTPPSTIDNRACVEVAGDVDPSNDCSTASVPQRAVAANVWVQCQADVPYLHYAIRTTPNLSGEPVTLQWTPSQPGVNGVPASDLPADPAGVTRTLHDGDDGSILWPGAAVSANGVGVGFPGWRPIAESDYDANGALRFPPAQVFEGLVYDPSTVASDAWRYPSVVTIRVNPTETYTVVYPPAVTACAVARVAQLGIVKTASTPLTHPGGSFGYTLQVDDLGLGAADPVTLTDPIPADLRVDSIATDATAFPRWQGCAVTGADGDGFGGTLTCTLLGPLSASAPSAPDVNLKVTVRSGTTASSISNTASVCSRHQGDAAAVTACADATAVVYLSVAALLAATGLDLYAAGGLALALLASGALLWTVLLRRRRRYADIAV
ncbi:MAG: DUF5979 domain-containing protein [Leifsonia sp.]